MAKKLDYIATEVLKMFKERGFNNSYIEDKQSNFDGKDRFAMLLWCNNLDDDCLEVLVKNLDVELVDFVITIRTLKSL